MFHKKRSLLIIIISSLFFVACTATATDIPATATAVPEAPTRTPRPTKVATRYPVPIHSFNLEEDEDTLTFENGSPIPAMTTFYKNQFIAGGCKLDSDSGLNTDAVVMVFKNCKNVDSLRVIIYANPNNGGSVISIAPDS